MPKYMLFAKLPIYGVLFLTILVQAQKQEGFISIDCGNSESAYTDEKTGINYISDTSFTSSGENRTILARYKTKTEEQQFWNVRSFPEGARNCYTLEHSGEKGARYLIRARFMYGKYDNKNETLEFDLHIGVNFWARVAISSAESITTKEIMHVPLSKRTHVCLVNTGSGTPFISVLELRPIESYKSPVGTALSLYNRYDFGSETNQSYMRYKDDVYDRLWSALEADNWTPMSTNLTQNSIPQNTFRVPFSVMRTAYTQESNMGIYWNRLNTSSRYFFLVHFAELVELQTNQTREFNIYINGNLWSKEPLRYNMTTIYSTIGLFPDNDGKIEMWFNSTDKATLAPLVNALEVYRLLENLGLETQETDVDAIFNVKSTYELVIENWQGDPCSPEAYLWDGINCSYNANLPPRITSLNLSSRGLEGEISPHFGDMNLLQYLDLSNNSLTGKVPDFANLTFLSALNLKGNNLEGPIPSTLLYRSQNGLSLSVDENLLGNETPPSSATSSQNNETSSSLGFFPGKSTIAVLLAVTLWFFP